MNYVTVLWSMVASACLTLGTIHLVIWCYGRGKKDRLCFAGAAFATGALAFCEMMMMQAETVEQYNRALRWLHVPVLLVMVSLTGLVRLNLGAGRMWLGWSALGMRLASLIVNFLEPVNMNFREVWGLRKVPLLGEEVAMAIGVGNPWMLLGQLGLVLFVLFMVDAGITVWRRGDRGKALVEIGSIIGFVGASTAQVILVLWMGWDSPLTASLFFMGTVMVWGYQLSMDTLRASRLAEDLQESQKGMRLAAAAARLATWTWDISKDRITLAPEGRDLYGVSQDRDISFSHFLACLHEEDREATQRSVTGAVERDGAFSAEYRIVLADGGVRWIAAQGKVEFDAQKVAQCMRGVSMDITQRKLASVEAERQRRELEHLSRVATVGELAGAIAHELGQPLGAILANAETAGMHLQSPAPDLEELREIVADIRADDLRAGQIIHGMRTFLKRQEPRFQALDAAELAASAVRLVGADLSLRKIRLQMEIAPGLPQVQGDAVQLQQVLVNLLINAMDAMGESAPEDRRITFKASLQKAGYVQMSLSDNGPGMPPEQMPRAFESFHTTKPGGLGLGLTICRSIIEAHGGSIFMENNPSGGLTVMFTIPVPP